MHLPPLPLIDGCLFVDNSMLELLTTCPRALEYNRFHQRVAAVSKPSLAFGSAIHLALEHRYKNYGVHAPDVSLEMEQSEILSRFFEANPAPADDFRNLNWAFEMVKRYNQTYDMEPFQLLTDAKGDKMVELSFALPLFTWEGWLREDLVIELKLNYTETKSVTVKDKNNRLVDVTLAYVHIAIIYTGRIDLPVIWDNQLFIGDHKTTSKIGPSFFDKMKMSAQQKGYAWAFGELTGQKPVGYFINAIRTKEPPLSLGKEGDRTKQTIAQWWRETFQRERYFLQPGELEEWKLNAIALVEELFYHYQKDYMPMKTAWCNQYGRCPYFDVCSLPAADRLIALNSNWYTPNLWNPLKTPTQSKQ